MFVPLILCLALLTVPLAAGGMAAISTAWHAVIIAAALLYQFFSGQDRNRMVWLLPWLVVSGYIGFQIATALAAPDPLEAFTREHFMEPPLNDERFPNTVNIGAALQFWASFSVFWITAWLVASLGHRRLRWVLGALVVLATFEALYGLFAFTFGQETILGIWDRRFQIDATGTFINRNHFAGMLAVCLPIGTAFLFASRSQGGVMPTPPLRTAAAVFFVVFVGMAIANSHSRLGLPSALLGVLAWFLLLRRSPDYKDEQFVRWTPIVMIVLIVLGTLWYGPVALIERFLRLPDATSRYDIWSAMLEFPLASWLIGIGAGSFLDAFHLVAPANLWKTFNYAHNDWLQFVLEFGIIGALLTTAALFFWFRRLRPRQYTLIQLAAVGGVIAIAIHSLGDFNLHIPGSAVVFWTAVGIVMNPNLPKRGLVHPPESKEKRDKTTRKRRRRKRTIHGAKDGDRRQETLNGKAATDIRRP